MTSSRKTVPFGLCHCGCGEKTAVSKKTYSRLGVRKGQPNLYVLWHQGRAPKRGHFRKLKEKVDAAPFKLRGEYCRVIPLNDGLFCIVSEPDYEWLMKWNWYASRDNSGMLYVNRTGLTSEGLGDKRVRMQRQVLGLERGDPRVGDHIDPWDTLDNSRSNLRIASLAQNARNCKVEYALPSSGARGVSFDRRKNRFRVRVCANGTKYSFGTYVTAEEASMVYQRELKRLSES